MSFSGNRDRGGWAPLEVAWHHGDNKPGGDFEGRMLIGLPTGLLVCTMAHLEHAHQADRAQCTAGAMA